MKKTKIVATLGPASQDRETLKKMIESGMNVARLNFSHGTHEWHLSMLTMVRELAKEMGVSVGILGDLQGPRIRTIVETPLEMIKGDKIAIYDLQFTVDDLAGKSKIDIRQSKILQLDVPGIVDDIEVGNDILIEDGLMKINILEKDNGVLLGEVIDGGVVKNHKGCNIPDAKLHIPPITQKDEKDLKFILENEVDFVAISFVSTGEEIADLRERMKKILKREDNLPQIIAKIERKEAMKNLEGILHETDAVMVARGDLAIEVDESRVAVYQKEIIYKCLLHLKPVIVATQMLNSMIENPRPTRAEISDVSNAVIDHADAVMLSGESASGKYPVESVSMMSQIIHSTEESPYDDLNRVIEVDSRNSEDYVAIVRSAYVLSKSFETKAIVMASISGFTAKLMSHFRPVQNLLVATNNEKVYNQLSLVWGVEPYMFGPKEHIENFIELTLEKAKEEKRLLSGDQVIMIMGRVEKGEKMRLVGVKEIR